MKYYIIAGEASGDLHGSNLIHAMKHHNADATFRVWGGDKMKATGAEMASHYKDMSFMGFVGLLKNIFKVFQKIRFCKNDIVEYQPDAIIFIDFSGFNLRIAKWAAGQSKLNNTKRYYYISPQVWASRSSRVDDIKASIDKVFCILPFEKAFYADRGLDVEYVGHPLFDEVGRFEPNPNFRQDNGLSLRPIIALLPGSRKQEIKGVLDIILSVIPDHADEYQFVIGGAPGMNASDYPIDHLSNLQVVFGQTYDLLHAAHAAIVTSGTATLETALFKVPQIVVYKGSTINYWIARKIISVEYISLVNLISKKEIVKELIQDDLNSQNLRQELIKILDTNTRTNMIAEYDALIQKLEPRGAADTTARMIKSYL